MYEKFFGLRRDPFSIAPDPRYLFMSERHREALAHLLYGLDAGGGFVLLSGDIGTGKTTVCRCFLEQIPANCNVAYIFNPKLTVGELLTSICDEFHVALPPVANPAAARITTAKPLIDRLNAFLLASHAAGKNNVLIIDEAQNLSPAVLEQLRLLTNLETNERKLLQIILIGQPELRGMLARPELEQLAQRVIARFHLQALSQPETADYIAHRLAMAGLSGPLPFDKKAMARAYTLSRGVPRRINLLCGRALLGAYASGTLQVTREMLDKAAHEVFGADAPALKSTTKRLGWISRSSSRSPSPSPLPSPLQSSPSPTAPRLPSKKWRSVLQSCAVGLALGALVFGAVSWLMAGRQRPTPAASTAPAKALSLIPAPTEQSQPPNTSIGTSSAAASAAATPQVLPPAPVSVAASTMSSRADFSAALAASTATQNQAWRALGPLWGVALNSSDACGDAQNQGVFCYAKKPLSLLLIRQLDRPGFVTLTNRNGQPVYALLTGLTAEAATLTFDKTSLTVPLAWVAETWNGSFSTLWKRPANMGGAAQGAVSDAATPWLAGQLALLAQTPTAASPASAGSEPAPARQAGVRERVHAFQTAQGLPANGQAGPLTMMQLNRATGVPEPRLVTSNP